MAQVGGVLYPEYSGEMVVHNVVVLCTTLSWLNALRLDTIDQNWNRQFEVVMGFRNIGDRIMASP